MSFNRILAESLLTEYKKRRTTLSLDERQQHLQSPLPTRFPNYRLPGDDVPASDDPRAALGEHAYETCQSLKISIERVVEIGETARDAAWLMTMDGLILDWARNLAGHRAQFVSGWKPVLAYIAAFADVLQWGSHDERWFLGKIPSAEVIKSVITVGLVARELELLHDDAFLPPAQRRGTTAQRYRGPKRGPRTLVPERRRTFKLLRQLGVPATECDELLQAWSLSPIPTDEPEERTPATQT